MPLEIVCSGCGAVVYAGFDLKSAKDVIRANQNKCKSCGKTLSPTEYSVDVSKSQMGH
ncbi:MAG: hypothetical protein ACRECH_14360 [Nitrososphaerales archaeon]